MQYETLAHVMKFDLLVVDDPGDQVYFDWTKVSIKKLHEEFGNLNKYLEYLAEYTPDTY